MRTDLQIANDIQLAALRLNPVISVESIATLEARCARINEYQVEFASRWDSLTRGGELTSLGQRRAARALGSEFQGKVKALLEPSLKGFSDNARQIEASLQPPPAPADRDPVLQYMKEQEIRQSLRMKDLLEIEILYREQIPNSPLALALERAPLPLIKPELVSEMRAQWARQSNPQESVRLDAIKELESAYIYVLKTALDEFPIPESGPAIVSV